MDLSFVIPCFNEQEAIVPLTHRLDELLVNLGNGFKVELIFVDDGSTDDTLVLLERTYMDRDNVQILRHPQNQGLGAAIRTGMNQAVGRFVGTIDSDCTYDPLIIPDMLNRMEPDVDVLTASPYAPGGQVVNEMAYQIWISQICSKMYRVILKSDIHTFTSMFRIYRRSVLETVKFRSDTFLCMAEILINAIQHKLNVQEYPTELSVRQHGYSKRKFVSLTFQHLKLMAGIIGQRYFSGQ